MAFGIGAAVLLTLALLYVWAGRREHAIQAELRALEKELETASEPRAREIRTELRVRRIRRAAARRELRERGDLDDFDGA